MTPAPSDTLLDREFAYTSHRDSCRDPWGVEIYCRRPRAHAGPHACGFGSERRRWP